MYESGGFPIKNGWITYSNKNHRLVIDSNGKQVIIQDEEDILKLRDKLNELYPVEKGE